MLLLIVEKNFENCYSQDTLPMPLLMVYIAWILPLSLTKIILIGFLLYAKI